MAGFNHNYIPNGDLQLWDAGPVPADMDAQVTATTITRLQRSQIMDPGQYDFIQNQNWADIRSRLDKFTYSGADSLRATLTAAAVADDFRIYPEGVAAANLAGACTQQMPLDAVSPRLAFTFAARCSEDGNLIRVRLALRTNADVASGYWDGANSVWANTIVAIPTNDMEMTTVWQRYGVVTDQAPIQVAANVTENMVWQISNATAGAQIIDLDDFNLHVLENSEG